VKEAYRSCDAEVDFKRRVFEPRPEVRGDIVRIYFYMSDKYNINLRKKEHRLLKIWSKQDPVDDWERTKNKRVQSKQGNANKFIQ
jgi:deoxyribonuclease-1